MPIRRTFDKITRSAFTRLKRDLRRLGVTVPAGDRCTIEHRHGSGTLTFRPRAELVEVVILTKPPLMPETVVRALLDRAMRRYTPSPGDTGLTPDV